MSTNGNGNGNGSGLHATGARAQILRLLKEHSAAVIAFETTLALMDSDIHARKQRSHGTLVEQALALDVVRRTKKMGRPKKRGWGKEALHARRQITANYLKKYSTEEPRRFPGGRLGVGTLLRHGYLTKKGKGFLRTEKQFTV